MCERRCIIEAARNECSSGPFSFRPGIRVEKLCCPSVPYLLGVRVESE